MDDNNKNNEPSLWEELLDFGIAKALGIIWAIYIVCATIALFLVDWFSNHK